MLDKKEESTWCPYPDFNLNSNTDGSVKLCCSILENHHLKNNGKPVNFATHDVEEIWSSDELVEIRKNFKENKKPKICDVCWNLEKKGLDSSRISALRDYTKLAAESADKALPTSLELRFGNKCNLKCVSCWSLSSSGIFEERAKALEEKEMSAWLRKLWQEETGTVQAMNLNWFKTEPFQKSLAKMAPNLKRVYLTGGEPTIIEENRQLLKKLVDEKNTSCEVSFTTNLSVWNENFFELLENFKNTEIQISIDGLGELNEYVRFPSKWQNIDKNLDHIIKKHKTSSIKIYTVMSRYNYMWLSELVEYLSEKFKERRAIWMPIVLQGPDFLSTESVLFEMRKQAQQKIQKLIAQNKESETQLWYDYGLRHAADQLNAGINDEKQLNLMRERAKEYILMHDRMRQNQHPLKSDFWRD